MKIKHPTDYAARRRLEYPPLADFADAFVHLQNGNPAPMAEYVARCNAVKARFAKRALPTGLTRKLPK